VGAKVVVVDGNGITLARCERKETSAKHRCRAAFQSPHDPRTTLLKPMTAAYECSCFELKDVLAYAVPIGCVGAMPRGLSLGVPDPWAVHRLSFPPSFPTPRIR
jgi:hypothetical protein